MRNKLKIRLGTCTVNLGGGLILISLVACGGGSTNVSADSANNINELQLYIKSLEYLPPNDGDRGSLTALTQIGNQVSFISGSANILQSIRYNYYSDSNCTLLVQSLMLNGPATLRAGSYTTSDQSLFSLCGNYSTGCSGLLSSALAQNVQAMQFTYNLTNGASATMPCMNNTIRGYEVIANYSNPSIPIACESGSQCGFSQMYPPFYLNFNSAIFAGTAATDASSASSVNGNVVAQTITGFSNPNVVGSIYAGSTPQFIFAQDQANSVYASALAQQCTTIYPSANKEFGGLTLGAGVYCVPASTASITGVLTLVGESTDHFTFVIGTSLTTATASSVDVSGIPGLPSSNVVWALGSSATLGTATSFFGTIDAVSAITCASSCNILGYLWAGTGVSLDGAFSTVSPRQ